MKLFMASVKIKNAPRVVLTYAACNIQDAAIQVWSNLYCFFEEDVMPRVTQICIQEHDSNEKVEVKNV